MLLCWRCGKDIAELSLPLSRLDECPACHVHLHVCRMCEFYAPAVTKACREDGADEVREKQRANFCDWFRPSESAFDADLAAESRRAAAKLTALFGEPKDDPSSDPGDPFASAAKLFKKD
jgi:hypothetical protein